MKKLAKTVFACLFIFVATLTFLAYSYAESKYSIIDIAASDSNYNSYGYGINNQGQVIGDYGISATISHAFVWDKVNGLNDFLNTPANETSAAKHINNNGQITGEQGTAGQLVACLWDPNTGVTNIGTLGGVQSLSAGINDNGQAVGRSATSGGTYHAFYWDKTNGISDIGNSSTNFSGANNINNKGQAVGGYFDSSGNGHATTWDNVNGMKDIGPGMAVDINASGQIVGFNNSGHLVLWNNGTPADLGMLNGLGTYGYSINDNGVIVGDAGSNIAFSTDKAPFIYENGTITDLNTLIPSDSGWTLYDAFDINNNGEIVGSGYYNGSVHAFLLEPQAAVPEPASMLLFGIGSVLMAFKRKEKPV